MKSEWQLSCNVFRSVSELALRFRWARYERRSPLDARERREPFAYTANLGQPDEPDYDDIPRKARQWAPRKPD